MLLKLVLAYQRICSWNEITLSLYVSRDFQIPDYSTQIKTLFFLNNRHCLNVRFQCYIRMHIGKLFFLTIL